MTERYKITDRWLPLSTVMEWTGLSRRSVLRYGTHGVMDVRKFGRQWRVLERTVTEYIAAAEKRWEGKP